VIGERASVSAGSHAHPHDRRTQKASRRATTAREGGKSCARRPARQQHSIAAMKHDPWPEDWSQAIERNKRAIEANRQFEALMHRWLTTDSDCAHDFRRAHGRLPLDVAELQDHLARRYGHDAAGRMLDRSLGRDPED
jgi:hypothetical protein